LSNYLVITPAYFREIWLGGILRTTSRSESANSFFSRFIGRKLALVEFWIRFDTALKCQRQDELIDDNTSMHTNPKLLTSWELERNGGAVFTHEVFRRFQNELLAAREHSDVQTTTEMEDRTIVKVVDNSNRPREVIFFSNRHLLLAHCLHGCHIAFMVHFDS
jgi:hypothetical protein